MSEQTDSTTVTEESNGQNQGAREFQAITSQEDFDKAIQARIVRERAKFENFDQYKADAAELAKIRDSQKTEAQKQQDAIDAVQRELAIERSARLRAEVAAAKSVPAELLSGSTQEELEASADALIKFRGVQADPRLNVPNEGRTPGAKTSTADAFAAFVESKL